jgi:broad specificity phosphatase PhoE
MPSALHHNLPIRLEGALAETHHTPGLLPSARDRYAYFPKIDFRYESVHETLATPGETIIVKNQQTPCENYPVGYYNRARIVAQKLEKHFQGQSILMFSHAATVAIVAALLKCEIGAVGRFAPCGIFKLTRKRDGPWVLERRAETNEHVSENSPTTFPWTFSEEHQKLWS